MLQKKYHLEVSSKEFPLICLVISLLGWFLVVDIIHQDELNKIIDKFNKI